MSNWLADVEARIARYASDEDMPQAEWQATGARIVMDAMRLLAVAKAAERLISWPMMDEPSEEYGTERLYVFCRGDAHNDAHGAGCRYQALAAALRGEGVAPMVKGIDTQSGSMQN